MDTVGTVDGWGGSLAAATAAYEGVGTAMDWTNLPTDTGLRVVSCGVGSRGG